MSRRHRAVAERRAHLPLEPLRRVLERHLGVANAIRLRDLIIVLGLLDSDPGRTIRAAIAELVALGMPIGSLSREGSSGYFWVVDERELKACVAELRSRAREIEARAEQLVEAFRRGPRQPALFALPREAAETASRAAPASGAPTASTESQDAPAGRPHEERFKPDFRAVIDRLSRTTPDRQHGDGR